MNGLTVGVVEESQSGETRVALTPASAIEIVKLGFRCVIQSGAGQLAGINDSDYAEVGVDVLDSSLDVWQNAQVILKIHPPSSDEAQLLRADQTLIGFFYPAQNDELLKRCAQSGASVVAIDMVPRISRAQRMDALSSMANLAGYRAMIEASHTFGRFLGGQITAAGRIPPANVLVIGAGVAGLASIGVATSLGAVVRAFDVRPEVAEQIESMGGQFVRLDFVDQQNSAATGGYAAPSSPEFRTKQLEKFRELAPHTDIVITTALIPGREAPRLWLTDMITAMPSGSVVVDLAAERGGNSDLTRPDEVVESDNGVKILGWTNLAGRMPRQSSELYGANLRYMLAELTPERDGILVHDMEDDVIRSATVAHKGEVTFPPPKPKIQAIAGPSLTPAAAVPDPPTEQQIQRRAGVVQILVLMGMAVVLSGLGLVAPSALMQHIVVFVLAVFLGFQVIWKVPHALHTPLMALTNAISGIVVVGALLQISGGPFLVAFLATVSVFIVTINIVGGFWVTRRMLNMFRKS